MRFGYVQCRIEGAREQDRRENNKMHKYTQKTRPEPHKATYLTYIEIESRDESG